MRHRRTNGQEGMLIAMADGGGLHIPLLAYGGNMLQSILIILAGTVCISRIEMLSRVQDTFAGYILNALPFLLVAQLCLYLHFNKASNVMVAWITWTITMSLLRVANSHYVLNEGLDPRWTLAGISLMVGAALCMKQA